MFKGTIPGAERQSLEKETSICLSSCMITVKFVPSILRSLHGDGFLMHLSYEAEGKFTYRRFARSLTGGSRQYPSIWETRMMMIDREIYRERQRKIRENRSTLCCLRD